VVRPVQALCKRSVCKVRGESNASPIARKAVILTRGYIFSSVRKQYIMILKCYLAVSISKLCKKCTKFYRSTCPNLLSIQRATRKLRLRQHAHSSSDSAAHRGIARAPPIPACDLRARAIFSSGLWNKRSRTADAQKIPYIVAKQQRQLHRTRRSLFQTSIDARHCCTMRYRSRLARTRKYSCTSTGESVLT